jgi:hypothetical protein
MRLTNNIFLQQNTSPTFFIFSIVVVFVFVLIILIIGSKRDEKLYDFKGKEINDKKAAPNYSNILYKIFQHKWNTKPYGNKNGACQDLKLAAKINAEGYYDYYIKMCVKP